MQFKTIDLSIGYPGKTLFSGLNLQAEAGELVCVMGPNGIGKSTFLRTISGQQKALAGEILIQGEAINQIDHKSLAKQLSIVSTELIRPAMMRVNDLIKLARFDQSSWAGNLEDNSQQDLEVIFDSLQIQHLRAKSCYELSDGEMQKVMIARALFQDAPLMILDEITSFLDLPSKIELIHLLKKLATESNKCLILASHDIHLVGQHADQIWLFGKDNVSHSGTYESLIQEEAFQKTFPGLKWKADHQVGVWTV